jgi:hypothetical protein
VARALEKFDGGRVVQRRPCPGGDGGTGVDHHVGFLTHQSADVGDGCEAEFSVVACREPESSRLRYAQRAFRLGLVLGEVFARLKPDIQQRAGVVGGGTGDSFDTGQPEEQGERQG